MEQNRRSFLKTSGLVAALSVTGLAGCTGDLLGDGSGSGDWKYDPTVLADVGNKFFGEMDYGQIYENRESLPESTSSNFEMDSDFPVEASDIDTVTGVGGARISLQDDSGGAFGSAAIAGSWDKSTMVDQIESEGEAQKAGEYEGFTLYENPESAGEGFSSGFNSQGSGMMGIGDGAMIIGLEMSEGTDLGVTGEETVTTMVDASNGSADLLFDNSQYSGQLNDEIPGSSMIVGGEVDPELVSRAAQEADTTQAQYIEGMRAGGFGASIEGETTTFTVAMIYESAERAEDTGIKGLVNGFGAQLEEQQEGLETLNGEYRDSAVVITVTGDTQTIFEEGTDTASGAAPGSQLSVGMPGQF
jgi:hypothetical protein